MYSKLIKEYEIRYNQKPQFFVSSSGRVNLIGEHVDYHEGIVLPCAISLKNILVGGTSGNYEAAGYSLTARKDISVNIDGSNIYEKGSSNAYLYGVCRSIIDSGHFIKGINFIIDGDLPIGSGLSSSASFCCCLIELISQVYRLNIERTEIAKIARMAENNYAGVPCGIMDQMAIVYGKEKKLVRIDCRDLSVNYCNMPSGLSIIIVNTMIKRQLAKSEYEKRQVECRELLEEIKKIFPNVKSLRDVSEEMLNRVKDIVPNTIYKRGKYVLEEIKRVDNVFEMMNSGNLAEIGRLFYEGHKGLKDEYEVSCDELNFIVDETYRFEGA
ncbi:MAG: galactokinase, partial [Deltaproteobacteria bacterium]|nr:galactokinase [Deltaproteobacteria bacterium]